MRWDEAIAPGARNFFTVLSIVRAPLLVTVAIVAFYAIPDQTIEIYRALAQDIIIRTTRPFARFHEIAIAAIGMLALGFAIWLVATRLLARFRYRIEYTARTVKAIVLAVPAVLMGATWIAAVIGIWRATIKAPDAAITQAVRPSLYEMLRFDRQFKVPEAASIVLDRLTNRLLHFNDELAVCAFLLAAIGVAAVAGAVIMAWKRPFRMADAAEDATTFLGLRSRVAVYACIALAVVGFTVEPLAAPAFVGPLGVAALFFVCIALLSGQLTFLADRHGVPYLTLLALAAGAIALLDLNDNHGVLSSAPRTHAEADAATAAKGAEIPPTLEDGFATWWKSRTDKDRYKADKEGDPPKRYPIYVVATEGGGIYAALHAATVLARLQDQCPYFAHHLFGISGVSGGSLGAAIFTGLASLTADSSMAAMHSKEMKEKGLEGPCLPQELLPYKSIGAMPLVSAADSALSEDLLSPVLSGLMFTDFLQSFLPVSVPLLDRGRRLDKGFEAAMQRVLDEYGSEFGRTWGHRDNRLTGLLRDWDPKGNVPALLLNTTEVETGQRRVLAPFVFEGAALRFFPLWNEAGDSVQARALRVSVATAASLSARFPWVTPAAWFQDFSRDAITGKALPATKDGSPQLAAPLRLVDGGYFENSGVATAVDLVRAMQRTAEKHGFADKIQVNLIVLIRGTYPADRFHRLKELLSPVQALLNTRSGRAYITIAEAEYDLNGGPAAARVRRVELKDLDYPMPLGWRLSTITSLLIRAQAGDARACIDKAAAQSGADCVLAGVYRELSGQ